MFSTIRRRMTYANLAATLALVFAMSGGAYAASRVLITSTGQVSPKVLKALKGKAGPAGAAGAQGPAGPAGAQGPKGESGVAGTAGTVGPKGETGATGARGPVGAKGETGATGSPWTAGGTLPSGQTETGVWATSGPEGVSGGVTIAIASFSIPLTEPEAVIPNIIGAGEGEGQPHQNLPAGCKGNNSKPEANPGNLCVFFTATPFNMTLSIQQYAVSTAGAFAVVEHNENEAFYGRGTWAVTAK
jgi:hypothetical protein